MPERDDERLDERLRRAGARWREHVASSDGALEQLPSTPRRRAWPAVAVAAAVVLVAVGLAVGLEHRHSRPAPSATPPTSDVVPWKPLPATHPMLPARTIRPTPVSLDVPPCEPGDLSVGRPTQDGAGGTLYLQFSVHSTTSGACRIRGYPAVLPYDHGRPLGEITVRHATGLGGGGVRWVRIDKQHPAAVSMGWAVSHDCRRLDNDRLQITLPYRAYQTGDLVRQSTDRRGFGRTTCEAGEGAQPMLVMPLHAQDPPRTRVVSPYDALRVSADLDRTVSPGQPVRFVVTLTSRERLVLSPCPDYEILTAAGAADHALNCAAVPQHDASGRPYLPAGVPVRFAMEADTGDQSTTKFLWRLLDDHGEHVLNGRLSVRR